MKSARNFGQNRKKLPGAHAFRGHDQCETPAAADPPVAARRRHVAAGGIPLRTRPRQRTAKQRTECSVCRTSPCAAAGFRGRAPPATRERADRRSIDLQFCKERWRADTPRRPVKCDKPNIPCANRGPTDSKGIRRRALPAQAHPTPQTLRPMKSPAVSGRPAQKKRLPLREAPSRIFAGATLRSRPQRPARARRSPRSAAKCYSASERLGRPPPFASARSRCTASRKRWNSSVFASSS